MIYIWAGYREGALEGISVTCDVADMSALECCGSSVASWMALIFRVFWSIATFDWV